MKARDTVIAWNGDSRCDPPAGRPGKAPPLSLAVGPNLREQEGDWVGLYGQSGGSGSWYNRCNVKDQRLLVMSDFWMLVFEYGLDAYLVHRAFCLIDEYVAHTKRLGAGPAKGEPGHDPEYGYGRCTHAAPTPIIIKHIGRSWHFWPGMAAELEDVA